ncbi:T9SS type B sorting domain-containing protein [Hanstruepera flava]|uniref:T9SS type B sorting domain-containing protein n=1 Tax=Hanstruepera flava TaxID=2930218 RepID=UPI00202821CD|nr:T9SS type B sorting domain-containing protein [Hanstruepera flava]
MITRKKHILIAFLALISVTLTAQNQAANWAFGVRAGLNFNFGYPIPFDGALIDTPEGCSSISDRLGNLLFYSDGITVWNKNNAVMLNGTGLQGDKSSTQSALIVPKPDDDTIFYIFTVDDRGGAGGLRYSEVNMALDGGLGGVTNNKNVLLANPTTEKITAIESSDGRSIWVISHRWMSNEYIAYLVSDTGVNTTPVVSAVGSNHTGDINNTIGYLKASPNREKIASVVSYDLSETQIFDFDATTGVLSNPITISNYNSNNIGPYGCEFSPDSNLLYVTEIDRSSGTSKVHQYDLTLNSQAAIINSDIIIGEVDEELGAVQQALDGRLYIAIEGGQYLSVIANPNERGADSNFEFEGVHLGGNSSHFGLPPFIQSYFFATNVFRNTCYGDTTEFTINTSTVIDSIHWDFGDPASGSDNTSTDLNPTHVFTTTGEFLVTISIDTEGEIQTVYRTLIISEQPEELDLEPLVGCEVDNGTAEFNLISAIPQDIIDDDTIAISYYEDLTDAENFFNPIINVSTYTNTANPQIIYVRLQNSIRGDCYSISELELQVAERPIIEETDSAFFCINEPDASIFIDAGPLEDNVSNYNFLWLDSNETTYEIEVQSQGTYTVRITPINTITPQNPDGCFAERVVTVSTSGIATINSIQVSGNSATINASGIGEYEYAIDDSDGPYQDNNSFTNLEPGIHIAYVQDKNGCGIVQGSFSIIGFPKIFTPNGDGENDYWQVQGISGQFQPNSKIYIFDRYGKLLKSLSPASQGWDGTFNGSQMPTDDYWFSVILEDGRTYRDHFTLKR